MIQRCALQAKGPVVGDHKACANEARLKAAVRTALAAVDGLGEGILELPAERKNEMDHATTRGGHLAAERLQLLLQTDDAAHTINDRVDIASSYSSSSGMQ